MLPDPPGEVTEIMRTLEFDVVIVGAGTAGACAAYHCATRGLSTALIDARSFDGSGAHWVNGVPPWMFERAGLEVPTGEECRSTGHRALLLDHRGRGDLWMDPTPIMDVDMALLVTRLQRLARDAGVECFEQVEVEEVELDGDRPVALRCHRLDGDASPEIGFRAKLFGDATGLAARLRKRVPVMHEICPEVELGDLCDAAQQTRRIKDPAAAQAWLERHGAKPGDIVSYLGMEGGYSTLGLTLDPERGHMEILTGAIADGRHKSGVELIAAFEAEHPWMGELIHGGSGVIPLRRPYDRLAVPGLALIGNSGCMVFPTHGSGIGSGMVAGRMLAEAACSHDDPGGEDATWAYTAAFQREIGAVNAAYDIFRRTLQAFDGEGIAAMIASGLMSHATSHAALDQRMPRFSPREVVGTAIAGLRALPIAVRLIPAILRTDRVHRHYRHYPLHPDEQALAHWSQKATHLSAES